MPADPAPSTILRPGPRLTAAWALSAVVLLLMVVQAVLGLADTGLYPEQPWAVAAFRGNDLVTLLLAAPVLAVAMLASRRRESSASVLVWLGMLHYGVYNYAYYSFGAAFSSAFLLHVAALVASIGGLLMLATSLDAGRAARGVAGGTRARVVAAFTTVVGVALIAAWGGLSLRFAITGDLPANVMPPSAVHLVYAIDLSLLAPVFVVAGVLLWRREPWGCGAGRGDQRERRRVPRRAVGGRRFPGGCRHPRHHVDVTGRDRLGARVHGRDARPARAPARRGRAGGCSVRRRPRRH